MKKKPLKYKQIKILEKTYDRLNRLKKEREAFTDVIERLIDLMNKPEDEKK